MISKRLKYYRNIVKKENFLYFIKYVAVNKLINRYFIIFKTIFNKELFETSIGKHFQNFIMKQALKSSLILLKRIDINNFLVKIFDYFFFIKDYRGYLNLFKYGFHEKNNTYLFYKLIKKGNTVLDIGANMGYFTLLASRIVGSNGTVIAFEPDPETFKFLNLNIKMNKITNVKLVNKCVSDEIGQVKLYEAGHHGSNSIFFIPEKKFKLVDAITLDNMLDNYNKEIRFIKMDIEGAEIKALRGMAKIILKNKVKFILLEVNKRLIKQSGHVLMDLISILEDYEFKKFYMYKLKIKTIETLKDFIRNIQKSRKKAYFYMLCMK